MALRPSRSATRQVVPAPANGSSTVAGTTAALQAQDGCQPVVFTEVATEPRCGCAPAALLDDAEFPRMLSLFGRNAIDVRSIARTQGAPHCAQTPFALVPARMHGSISAGGKTAKWLSG